jgi:hypothetical protein
MAESLEQAKPQKEAWRSNYVPAPHFFNLNQACVIVNKAFGDFGCYLVGSATERRNYRDVDVRFIMADAVYDRMFKPDQAGHGYVNSLWSLLCQTISLWLSQQSGLPIDFQIQRQTEANTRHPGAGRRQPLGILIDYPGERPSDINPSSDPAQAPDSAG